MKKAILYTILVGVVCAGNTPVIHAETDISPTPLHVTISEIQTSGTSDATEEFVELYNPSDQQIDMTGWLLQYRAASGTTTQSWSNSSTKSVLACPNVGSVPECRVVIAPKNRVVLTHTIANIASALAMSGGFSSTGGQIRLVQPGVQQIVHDFVGYGTSVTAEHSAAPAPANGKSIKRIINAEHEPIDTDNNANDFIAGCGDPTPGLADTTSTPRATGCETPQSPETNATTTETETSTEDTPNDTAEINDTPTAQVYLPAIITEVFADPESPQQDSTDEFIEIYNPNDTAITLKDYRLQTGNEFRYTYTLGDTPLGPHMYLAIPSAVSKLSLANSGSGVRLIDPNGVIAYEAPNYGEAKPGQSWMQDDAGWKWTLTPTPGAVNTLTAPAPKVVAASTTTKKKTATKTAATKKPVVPKQTKAPAAKKNTTETPKTQTAQVAAASNPQYWLLAPIGALAVSYAAYEYRQGISRGVRTGWAKLRKQKPPTEQ